MKRIILAIVAVFVAWSAMDYVIHEKILSPIYGDTAELWRPHDEMKMNLMMGVTAIVAAAFVLIFSTLAKNRNAASGIQFGFLYGIATGVSMGFGTYSVTPIPLTLAWGWLLGTLAETIVAGIIVGAIVKDPSGTINE